MRRRKATARVQPRGSRLPQFHVRQPAAEPGEGVLVIDDDEKFLSMIKPLLANAGYEVLTANSGPRGLDLLRYTQDKVRAVLLDFSMPQFDGSRTIHYLRKLAPSVKVIGITGVAAAELPDDYREGVDALMFKPFQTADMLASLRALLHAAKPVAARG